MRDRFTCVYCGRSAPQVVLEADHKVAQSKGGTDDESNLVTACRDCNAAKSDKDLPADHPAEPLSGAAKSRRGNPRHPLVGKFAHTFHLCEECGNRRLKCQLEILSQVGDDRFLVQFFEWLVGTPSTQRIFSIADMREWEFYDAAEDWRYGADIDGHRHLPCDKKRSARFAAEVNAALDTKPLNRLPLVKAADLDEWEWQNG